MHRLGTPWRVGADPAQSVAAAAGVSFQTGTPSASSVVAGIDQVAKSSLAGKLSNAGKLVLSATSAATGELASGDYTSAAAIASAGIVMAASYQMLQPLIDAGIGIVTDTVGELVDAVPLLGAVVNILILGVQNPAGAYTPGEIDQKCRNYYRRVVTGNGGSITGTSPGTILPADLFMGTAVDDSGKRSPDAFGWLPQLPGDKSPPADTAGGSLASVLRMLEEPVEQPDSASAKAAKIAWPNAGLAPDVRIALKQLRLGMSAGYVNADIPRLYTPGLTDGGTTAWPVYADLLTSEFRWGSPGMAPGSDQSRIPKDWVRWRFMHRYAAQRGDADKADSESSNVYEGAASVALVYANASAQRAQKAPTAAAKNPLAWTTQYIYDHDVNFTLAFGNCYLFDFDRAWGDFYGVVSGWFKGVYAPDPDLKFPASVDGAGETSPIGAALLLAGVFVGAYALGNPSGAATIARQGAALASKGAKAAASGAKAAVSGARWGAGQVQHGAQAIARRVSGKG